MITRHLENKKRQPVPLTHLGFTGHETIESMNLIHMDGRIYDPHLARFLSADPQIQAPDNTQSLNRYSYCLNNPLAYTDPTGYGWFSDLCDDVGSFFHDIGHAIDQCLRNPYVSQGLGIAIAALAWAFPPAGMAAWISSAIASSIYSGFETNANGGDFQDALESVGISFGTACVWHYTGDFLGELPEQVAKGEEAGLAEHVVVHGLVGGGLQVIEGGSFKDGFLSAAITEALPINDIGKGNDGLGAISARTAGAAIVGGTIASVTGGNFENGAQTAAYAELFSDAAQAAAYTLSTRTENYFSNTYASKEDLEHAMEPGSIVFGIRRLGPLAGIEFDLDFLANHDLGAYHENVFVMSEDHKLINYDYSPAGIRADKNFPGNISQYQFSRIYDHVNITYSALSPRGFTGALYNLFTHNCQVYSDVVRSNLRIAPWYV